MNVFTEEEAEQKWCPHTDEFMTGYCVASKCMMWRWQSIAAIVVDGNSPVRLKIAKHVDENSDKYGLKTEPFLGSCGIVSK